MKQPQFHEYVIVGAGISAFQAALILAENEKDFIMIEASDRIGGRICTKTLQSIIEEQQLKVSYSWLQEQQKKMPVEFGATWLSSEQSFMHHIIQHYGLTIFPQYYDGKHIYALNQNTYVKVDSLNDFFKPYESDIKSLLAKIKLLDQQYEHFNNIKKEGCLTAQKAKSFSHFVQKYDSLSIYQYFQAELPNNTQLSDILSKEIQHLSSLSSKKVSVLQILQEFSNFENVLYYIGVLTVTVDGFRIKQGTFSIIQKMKEEIQTIFNNKNIKNNIDQLIKLNQPVTQIKNNVNLQKGQTVAVILKNGIQYRCRKVILATPLATTSKIKFQTINLGKKLILENQQPGRMTRMSMIFKRPFWRTEYCGYASFSNKFHMNELVELSPSNLSCGILAFVFSGDGYNNWCEQIQNKLKGIKSKQEFSIKWQEEYKSKAMQIIADMFLQGNIQHEYLKEVIIFARTLSSYQYIGSTYQSSTKLNTWSKVHELNQDYKESYLQDQKNVIFIGSDFGTEFASYMEGAVRLARRKIYQELHIKDPLEYLRGKLQPKL